MKKRLAAVSMLTLSAWGGTDAFVGTWKLDPGRSKFARGDPSFLMATMQIEATGDGLKSTASAADGKGIASDFTFTCPLDGTPCKIISIIPLKGASAVDTISLKRVDDQTIVATGTKDERLVYTDRRVVSADGKTLTVRREGITLEGRKYESTMVLVKVR